MKEKIWKPSVIEGGVRASIAEEVAFSEAPLRKKAMTRVWSHQAGGRVVINLENRE